MFSRKTKELIKAGSISKKSRSGCAAPNSSLSVLQEQPYRDASDGVPSDLPNPSSSCPGTPLAQHTKLGPDGPPEADALKRSAPLSRHSSAAGFPLQSWVLSKGLGKGTFAHGSIPEGGVAAAIEVEDIPQLLCDVARFAKAMEMLKDVVLRDGKLESRRSLAHEFLGEGLRVLRLVISTYPLLSTVETLTAAGKLISKVKGFRYERCNEADKKDFEKAIENIAVAFSSNVSELLMGEVDSNTLLSLLPRERSRSMDNLYRGMRGLEGDIALGESDPKHCTLTAEEVDIILQCGEGGVDSALAYAKAFSKYMKDVVNYVEKRIALEAEFARGLQRVYQSCKQSFEQFHMPFISMYSQALEQDLEQSLGVLQATNTLHSQTFLQPLLQRRLEHERKRRETREQWQRAKRKLMEAETNLRKAKQAYMARREEYDKAKTVASRAEGEGSSSSAKSLDRKRRQEEETRNKAEEAEATYRTCSADATTQHQELEDVKVSVLQQLQELIRQSDQTLRCATVSYFQTMHMQTVALPVHYQALCETSKLYNLGQQYAFYVKDLGLIAEPEVHYDFEPYTTSSSQSSARAHKESFNTECQNNGESSPCSGGLGPGDGVSTAKETQSNRRGHKPNKSWPSTGSDTDSVDGSSGLGSPSTSTGDVRKMARTLSTGTTSSTDELIEKDKDFSTSEQSMNGVEAEIAVPTGPFRNVGLSKAAQTHRLRKLRTPAKCRECDSYVYFQGAECEECFLACHKKCLETLAIQCGHKKLQGRLQLFGRDFSKVSRGDSLGIPFIIKKCISEIERRALKMKGIYRVNGVKTRVEKMCQAFENGMELVELSQASPHDVSNVLKLYLRQLPEPIIPFRLYSGLMGLAKESLQAGATEEGESGKGFELVDLGPETDPDVLVMVDKLRDVLKELPRANVATLGYIVRHLCRVAEFEQENKMTPSNLGIVFGPALMRPRPTGATVSLSSLMDYPHQARIVEMLVVYHHAIFPSSSSVSDPSSTAQRSSQDHSTDGRVEEPGQEGTDRNSWQDPSVKTEVFVNSVGSYGSCEQSLDSDSDLEQTGSANRNKLSHCARQDSETSTEDDGLSSRGSLDLLSQSPPHPVQEQLLVTDGHPPAALNSEHPDLELSELKLASSPELNVNNSNNRAAWAPAALPVVRVSGGMLAMRDEEREPAFV